MCLFILFNHAWCHHGQWSHSQQVNYLKNVNDNIRSCWWSSVKLHWSLKVHSKYCRVGWLRVTARCTEVNSFTVEQHEILWWLECALYEGGLMRWKLLNILNQYIFHCACRTFFLCLLCFALNRCVIYRVFRGPDLPFLSVLAGNTGQHAWKLIMIVCTIAWETTSLLFSYQSSKHVIFLEVSGVASMCAVLMF